ncbi:hypothetical protein [Paraglaciecola psychrophila]|uniref:NIPSNAP domain-containing protein n=1 Tax=Paraglaciecola psychrophila 170 TaxID=1129794 RepID=K7AFZ1_9ALTE|nr:hypothetical protein [Paraglaciecola psychrophila]AGH45212.1 hypothetical protein C427_3103 [Paraglaciecola psychrophila 170]GAC39553.1 hypothetical protein GPSY_3942 [Paraglaciecola psychrophila 170]
MKTFITKPSVLICLLSLLSFNTLAADERVFKNGDYWEVSSITVVDGQWLNYAKHLSTKWRDSQEFAKSKGWINGYKVIINQYPRDGEPDMYLITMFETMATKAQDDERYKAYMQWSKSTIAKLEESSGERVVMRHLSGNALMREVTFR